MSKIPRQKAPKGRDTTNSSVISEFNVEVEESVSLMLKLVADPRFANIHTDPRFRIPSRKDTHVKLDQRFAHMLRDDDFSKKARVDRYGRQTQKGSGRKELERFYELEDRKGGGLEPDEEDVDDDTEVRKELERIETDYDPARGGGFSNSESSFSEDEESTDEEEEEAEDLETQVLGLSDVQAGQDSDIPMGEVSKRLAVVNLDWDNIRAVDLLAVFSSFCPPSGRIQKVAVYPSEFGRERMEREETEGPPREIFTENEEKEGQISHADDEDDEDDDKIKSSLLREDKGEEFDTTNLRRYQLERLRYYYAVLTLSSPETAKSLYESTDGTEFLTTANFFDLRFVPDEVSFEDDRPRDECTKIPGGYKPNTFVTNALQHSKVKLTWDADDRVRKDAVRKAFSGSRADIEANDLKAYLGSDSSDDDDSIVEKTNGEDLTSKPQLSKKEVERQRLRAALGLADSSSTSSRTKPTGGPVGDMQITFSAGLSANDKRGSTFENEPVPGETTVEKYIRKEKERKHRRKEKAKDARDGADDTKTTTITDGSHTKGGDLVNVVDVNAKPESDEDLGFADPFFTTPNETSKNGKSTVSARKAERLAKRQQREQDDAKTAQQRAELELLMLDDDDHQHRPHPGPSEENDTTTKSRKLSHFNLNEILRAEKKQKRSSRKANKKTTTNVHDPTFAAATDPIGPSSSAGKVDDDQQAGFRLNTEDPRFAAIYSNHEFAIDPTNPRFKPTRGMNSILEEGRRRRKRGHSPDGREEYSGGHDRDLNHDSFDHDDDGEAHAPKKTKGALKSRKRRRANDGVGDEDIGARTDEMKKLVEKVKRREKQIVPVSNQR
ncbi:MAG: pre-rRNA-processing protein esf1 [Sclerophora amabilis]|nr:MAG: pre-rRNA-processing protein esf1 [Sclerophora amabilis]